MCLEKYKSHYFKH